MQILLFGRNLLFFPTLIPNKIKVTPLQQNKLLGERKFNSI